MPISLEQALQGSPTEKGKYLRSLRFMHRNLQSVMDEVQRHMTPFAGLSTTIVVGPTGVGKSTFSALQAELLLKLNEVEIREDPGAIPVVLNEVDAADGKEINWSLFYQHLLQDLHTVCPDFPIGATNSEGKPIDVVKSYRRMFENALRERKVRHLILDEAVHFADSSTEPLQYGNLLKSLANRTNMNLLLVGAYRSEMLVKASGQLGRRIGVVHFPRYRDNQDDFDAFTRFIKEFAEHIPLPFKVDLSKYVMHLFTAHFGLPGWAAETLIAAVNQCASEGSVKWKDEYVINACPSPEAFDSVSLETLEGEANVERYLKSPHPRTYPTEDEMRARLVARKANGGHGKEAAR